MKILSIVASIFAFVVGGMLFGPAVSAISESGSVYQKILYEGINTCYNLDVGGIRESISLQNYDGRTSSLITTPMSLSVRLLSTKNGSTKNGANDKANCLNTFKNDKMAKVVPSNTTNDIEQKNARLTSFGYSSSGGTPTGDSADVCYSYKYIRDTLTKPKNKDYETYEKGTFYTPNLCVKTNSDGSFETYVQDLAGQYDSPPGAYYTEKPIEFVKIGLNRLTVRVWWKGADLWAWNGYYTDIVFDNSLGNFSSAIDLLQNVGYNIASTMKSTLNEAEFMKESTITTWVSRDYAEMKTVYSYYYYDSNQVIDGIDATQADIEYTLSTGSVGTALRFFSDGAFPSVNSLKFNDEEIYTLYSYYLSSIYEARMNGCFDSSRAGMGTQVKLWSANLSGYSPYCYVTVSDSNKEKRVNGVDLATRHFGVEITFDELIATLNSINPNEQPSEEGIVVSGETIIIDGNEDPQEVEMTCSNSGALESLGWILCPALEIMSNASQTIYTDYVEPALQVDPTLFSADDPNADVRQAWGIFQGISNTVFIILFLVVIFSQLTGVGIDNYGIKRILPKLIIAAILINLSYLICVVCVDLSNIIGTSIKSMFDGWAEGQMVSLPVDRPILGGIKIGGITRGALTGVVVLVGMVASAWSAYAAGGLVGIALALFVVALEIVLAIFFLFLLLSAREAAIVVLTVISPLAFVCYILPNTKRIFDRWLRIGWGLLLVYPICGLLVGGGNFVSSLLLAAGAANGGFATGFMAMAVGVVPIFFIPTVLKGSFTAMGNLGTKIAGIGTRVRTGAARGIRGSKAYRDAQERGREAATMRFAGVKRNEDGTYGDKFEGRKMSAFSRLIRGGDRNIAASRAQFRADQERRGAEANLMGTGFAAGLAGVEAKVDQQREANAEAMLGYGRATYIDDDDNIVTVDSGNTRSVGAYHAAALRKYHNATTNEERANALAEVKAAQKLLSRTDAGRGAVQTNLSNAVIHRYGGGVKDAAMHLQSNFGDLYKSKNRGADRLIGDLASGRDVNAVARDINSGVYEFAGAEKYDQASLVGADEMALQGMQKSVSRVAQQIANGEAVSPDDMMKYNQIRNTANRAIDMYDAGRLSVKPEVLTYIENIAGRKVQRLSGTGAPGAAREGETFSPRQQGANQQGTGRIQIASEGDLNEFLRNRNNGSRR